MESLREGQALLEAGRYREADARFARAADRAREKHDLNGEEAALLGRAQCMDARFDQYGFLEVTERLLAVQGRLENREATARTEADLGTVLAMLGDRARARFHLGRAIVELERLGRPLDLARALATSGLACVATGDVLQGLRDATRSVAVLRELLGAAEVADASRLQPWLTYALQSLGGVRVEVGDARGAVRAYEEALGCLPAGSPDWKTRTDLVCCLAAARSSLEGEADRERTQDELLAALDRYEAHGDSPGELLALLLLGDLYASSERFQDAYRLYARARTRAPQGTGLAARALLGLARIAAALDRLDEARGLYADAADATAALGHRRLQERAHTGMAQVHLALGEPLEALKYARRAATFQTSLAEGLDETRLVDTAVYRDELTDIGIQAALMRNRVGDAIAFMEHGRVAALLQVLGAREALLAVDVPEGLRRRYEQASLRHTAARLQLEAGRAGGRLSEIKTAREDLAEARVAYSTAAQDIDRSLHAGARVRQSVVATLPEIQSALWPGEVLVLYALLPEEAVAAVVTSKDARLARLGERAPLEALCGELDPSADSPVEGELERLKTLGQKLLGPLDLPADMRLLLVSPDGVLSRIPFPVLSSENGPSAHETVLVPSGSIYRLLGRDRGLRGEHLLALGDPRYGTNQLHHLPRLALRGATLDALPFTREEIAAIRQEGDTVLLDEQATEGRLFRELETQNVWRAVHLACHGLILMNDPEFSSCAITPGDGGDGFLTTLEILKSRIRAELVVLSACETGLGPVKRGEGILGFARAFMTAGTPRVLASLWRVDDEATCLLMDRFYDLWRPETGGRGPDAAAALRAAQEYVRTYRPDSERDPPYAHPVYWAGWVLWGLP